MGTSAFATGPQAQAISQMNITPLVDVMLVLLVIFMVAAPAVTGNLDMRLPQPGPGHAPVPRVRVQVRADGSYLLDGQYQSAAALKRSLGAIARSAPSTVVSIQADQGAEYQAFTTALSAARSSGVRSIALGQ